MAIEAAQCKRLASVEDRTLVRGGSGAMRKRQGAIVALDRMGYGGSGGGLRRAALGMCSN
jgi:hypothetical protein